MIRRARLCLFLILGILFCLSLPAQPQTAPPVGGAVTAGDDAPVPVPQPTEKALRYYKTGNAWWVFNQLWSVLIPVLFLFTGFSARIRNWARRIGRKWFFVLAVYFVIF